MSTTKPLTGPLKKSDSHIANRDTKYVRSMFKNYKVKSLAIYVDHTTVVRNLPNIPGVSVAGYFTFDIKLVGGTLGQKLNRPIQLLSLNGPIPHCDGWLIASTSRASAFSVCKALLDTGNEHQIICRFYGGQTTKINAYMDIFSGETETIIYLNHYFNRKYRITFPMDVRYSVCTCNGTIIRSGQRIIPPGGITIFDSREMNLGNFEGYLQIELEVENLQVRVQPFIHFWADYISEAGICRNHQSGWAPWPAGSVFNRGYFPIDPNLDTIGSFYNAGKNEATVKALLHYNQRGVDKKVVRVLRPIPAGEMSYQNLSKIFHDISLEEVNAAYLLLKCNQSLHRPNYYITTKGSRKFIETFHQTGGAACYWTERPPKYQKGDLERFERFGLASPCSVQLPILEEHFNIETYLGLLSLTLCNLSKCVYSILDSRGKEIFVRNARIDSASPLFMNINKYAQQHNVDIRKGGTFCLSPIKGEAPKSLTILLGLKHVDFPNIATSFRGSPTEANLPYYISAGIPKSREYDSSPLTTSDHFVPGVSSAEYDSLIMVEYQSLLKTCKKRAHYRLDIIDSQGKQYSIHRSINPKTYDIFWLGRILAEAGISSNSPYYTLWIKSYDIKLKPFHSLYRKSDHALSLDDGSEGTLQTEPQV